MLDFLFSNELLLCFKQVTKLKYKILFLVIKDQMAH